MEKIIDDKRKIKAIYYPDENGAYRVGHGDITKIKPYEENGEMTHIIWFAIYKGNELKDRVNGKYVESIHYF